MFLSQGFINITNLTDKQGQVRNEEKGSIAAPLTLQNSINKTIQRFRLKIKK